MPRPLKKRTPLRELRDTLSEIEGRIVTQETMAERLRTSASLINAVEAGNRALSPKLLERVEYTYGVSLQPGKKPFAYFDPKDIKNGIAIWLKMEKTTARECFDNITALRVEALIEAADETKYGAAVCNELEQAIKEIIADFGIEEKYTKAWTRLVEGERLHFANHRHTDELADGSYFSKKPRMEPRRKASANPPKSGQPPQGSRSAKPKTSRRQKA